MTPPTDQTSWPNLFIFGMNTSQVNTLRGSEAIFEFLSQSLKNLKNQVFYEGAKKTCFFGNISVSRQKFENRPGAP